MTAITGKRITFAMPNSASIDQPIVARWCAAHQQVRCRSERCQCLQVQLAKHRIMQNVDAMPTCIGWKRRCTSMQRLTVLQSDAVECVWRMPTGLSWKLLHLCRGSRLTTWQW
ncbi:hypothetical protein VDF54_20325 [Xanthomonas campestris pv. raphani]|uniref:hypothetical protein n=1 Tax=Xanthomonas campestris TaxID=339 RepID=UPI002B22F3EA|nr:hypothetical protein [Xanthomonas campestris]MEA9777384.1 hypothetical protein [Xanthomonas campestris pv. raphani]